MLLNLLSDMLLIAFVATISTMIFSTFAYYLRLSLKSQAGLPESEIAPMPAVGARVPRLRPLSKRPNETSLDL